jgi:hypothetical protein
MDLLAARFKTSTEHVFLTFQQKFEYFLLFNIVRKFAIIVRRLL